MTPDDTFSGGTNLADRYEILSVLGTGSFGQVYRARQLSTGQDVAIKTVRIRQGDTSGDLQRHVERFRREMRLCAALSHPHIVRLRDSGEVADGTLFAVFEFVPGVTLREVIQSEGRLEQRETIRLMGQVLDALACAHAEGIVHRDLKPENIMITKTGVRRNAMVLDFGLGGFAADFGLEQARLTATHEMMGTPCYAAPEQLRGDPPSPRSDIYSWGLVFLECLTGEIAMRGATTHEVLLKQLSADPVPLPPALKAQRIGRVLEAVTVKNVDARRVTIAGLLETLSALEREASERSGARPPQEGERRPLTLVACRATVARADGAPVDLEDLDQVLQAQLELYQRLAGPRDGTVVGAAADRGLLAFGYPRAQENDARRAVRTALHIAADTRAISERLGRERGLTVDVHIGVHSGLVIVRESPSYEIVGIAPHVAVRISDRAAAQEVLLSDATKGLLRGAMECDEAGVAEHLEPGKRTTLYRVRADTPPAGLATTSGGSEPSLVERVDELAQLTGAWQRAESGEPRVVLLVGEPGVGKSRLVRELRQLLPPAAWIESRCTPEHRASPLRPVIEVLESQPDSPAELVARYGLDPAAEPLLASLLELPEGAEPSAPMAADVRKERTLALLVTLLVRMAARRPRALVVEDLHWADPTTIELLTALTEELRAAAPGIAPRLCVVLTARPEFPAPWNPADVTTVSVPRLSRAGVESMIRSRLRGDAPPPDVVDHVAARTDGVPLFVEELTHLLLDTGALAGRGAGRPGWETAIPATLRELLTARLDALSATARETAQLAAAIGREVRHDVLAATVGEDEGLLQRDVRELIDARLLQQRRSTAESSYVFRHALVRDAAYESMLRPTRQRVHRRIATTVRERFPDIAEHQPEVVAHHLEAGGDAELAVIYWQRAGDRALRRAAYQEARQHIERGLAAAASLPASPLRTRAEIELLTTLGTALLSTQGFASPEVEATFARAHALCEQAEGRVPAKIYSGIIGVAMTRSDRQTTERLLPYIEQLADSPGDVVEHVTAYNALGIAAFWRGDHLLAQEYFERSIPAYRSEEFQRYVLDYGYDGGIFCCAYLPWNLWVLGRPIEAERRCEEVLAIAEGSRDPHARSLALTFSMQVSYSRRDLPTTLKRAERCLAVAAEQKLFFWSAVAMCVHGAAVARGGAPADGIPEVRQGLALSKMLGNWMGHQYYTTFLIEALVVTAELDEATAVIDEELALCQSSLGRFHEPELLRLLGLAREARGDAAGAEAAYRDALALARERSAHGWGLRAATNLGSLLHGRGADADARALVTAALAPFGPEAADEEDVRAARALRAALG